MSLVCVPAVLKILLLFGILESRNNCSTSISLILILYQLLRNNIYI